MNNFNTSSVGDVRNYSFTGTRVGSITVAPGNDGIFGFGSNTLTSPTFDSNYISFDNGGSGYLEFINKTPNPTLTVQMTSSVNPGGPALIQLACSKISALTGTVQDFDVSNPIATNTSTIISGSVIITNTSEGDRFQFYIINSFISTGTLTCTDNNLKIVQTPTTFNGSSSLTILDPYIPNFDYNEYNPLLDNADIPQTSVFFMDVDYSQNPVIPVNQELILDGGADRAQVQDSNYTSYSWSGIRYNGSKNNSVKFN
jgi:hypothetical protein